MAGSRSALGNARVVMGPARGWRLPELAHRVRQWLVLIVGVRSEASTGSNNGGPPAPSRTHPADVLSHSRVAIFARCAEYRSCSALALRTPPAPGCVELG